MNEKMTKATALILAFALGLAGAYYGSAPVFEELLAQKEIRASWKDHFATVEDLREGVDAIVVGEVVAMRPGRVVGDPSDPDIEFTNVSLSVSHPLKGRTEREIVVEVTGNLTGERVVFLDLPRFELGQAYLLFLNRSAEADVWYVVNNQGGYHVARSDNDEFFVRAADPEDEVASEFDGLELSQALIRAAGEIQDPRDRGRRR